MIPKEPDGEIFEDALARVRRCVGGRTATENADSDPDLEAVVTDFVPVNLRCPVSKYRLLSSFFHYLDSSKNAIVTLHKNCLFCGIYRYLFLSLSLPIMR